ncbi:hypothetical protein SEVIR_9G188501v4 [Setaria viridis]|uniref:WAT1-related protein n=1 Tax=Setaria viridis TaxID=4556 RepID=A0A4U6SVH1_SETVI|nr:WAT1-related protein At5g64700-like isoform X3 [Setaria viridis]XP_034576567.1 WAT1-related protein At5g64700-like isoform X3 [Setaria viridis]TKV92859.1 hypothetical protein SEVIR_9G188501v2 [Setaria viridis]TKV92860.1 hypothetical protein SEVIR_9G188501v2 [Setaria viridis]TKV92861.1 hypothetical protein SEVIR_9G188501v2 [Setaria viridis]
MGLDFPECYIWDYPCNGAVLLRAAQHQCHILCHLPESDPRHDLSHRHHTPGRELDPYKLVWKDEALRHLDMCWGNDDGQTVQRQAGASSLAYPPAEITVPCSDKPYPSPQYGCWHIVPVRLAKVFPFRYWATTLTCLSGSLQAFVIGILIDSKKSAWTLKWDLQLLTVIYSGVFTTSVAFMLMSWAVKRRGPIYPPMFNSLAMIATVVMDSVLLDTNIFLGSILGTLLVILGLYTFLLGKGKELQHAAAAQKANQKQYTSNGEQGGHELQLRHGDEIA